MQKISSREFLSGIAAGASRLRVPHDVTFELSYGCNLRCAHCFNPTHQASKDELRLDEIFRILEQMSVFGVLDVCFTGGEPTLHPHFFEILERAGELGMTTSMNTNATLIGPAAAARLSRSVLQGVYVSIYGAAAETYEAVTGVPGSHARFRAGLDALLAAKLPVTLQMPVLTLNRREVRAAHELARRLGVKLQATVDIYPRQDGNLRPLEYRLPPADKLAALAEIGAPAESCAPDAGFFECDCGKTQFAVTPFGEMNLCTIFPHPEYDLRRGSVREGWEVLKRAVDVARPGSSYQCPSCEVRGSCRQGRADSWLEKRDMGACLPHFKELARLEKENGGPVHP